MQGYYYLNIPLMFYDHEMGVPILYGAKKDYDDFKYEDRVRVNCRIHYTNKMMVQVMLFVV